MEKEEYEEFKAMPRKDVVIKYALKLGKGEIDREEYARIMDLYEQSKSGKLEL